MTLKGDSSGLHPALVGCGKALPEMQMPVNLAGSGGLKGVLQPPASGVATFEPRKRYML
jgi:hypothetical protein